MRLSDNIKGAVWMTGSMAAFALNDTCMKLVTADMTVAQAVVLRGIGATVLIGVLAARFGALRFRFSRSEWRLIMIRASAEIAMTWFFLKALTEMPIANLHAVTQALPMTVALAAAVFLREPIGLRRMIAILLGLVGVLLIVRPGSEGFDVYSLYGLAAVGFITLRDLLSRRLPPEVPSLTIAFITALVITVFFALTSAAEPWAPVTLVHAQLLGAAAIFIFFGYLLSVMTMRVGDIGFIAPFRYTGLIFALILGFVVFDDWPAPLTFLGAGIVVGTGLFMLYREQVLLRRERLV